MNKVKRIAKYTFNGSQFLVLAAVFLAVGLIFIVRSSAANLSGDTFEAENGTVSGISRVVDDDTVSGDKYVSLSIQSAPTPTVLPSPTPTQEPTDLPSPVRVMPLGDSITVGMHGTGADWDANKSLRGGYRAKLFELLTAGNYAFDFVGSGDGIDPRETLPDLDHEGHGGWRITGGFGGGLDSIIGAKLTAHDPNVILLHIGTNDLFGGDSADALAANYAAFLDTVFTQKPGVYVFVSALKLNGLDSDGFNAMLQELVQQRAAAGNKIWYVDTAANASVDFWGDDANGLHPSLANYEVMGQNWYDAIIGAIPGFPIAQ